MNYKHTTLLAAIVLMGLTIFASCKKDNETKTPEANGTQCASITHPEQIDDMSSYLKQFKAEMQNAKAEESLSLEEAEWHFTALQNYDFCYANVEKSTFQFDTIYGTMKTSSGRVLLSELDRCYEIAFEQIISYYKSQELENKNFYYIVTNISEIPGNPNEMKLTTIMCLSSGYAEKGHPLHLAFPIDSEFNAMSEAPAALTAAFEICKPNPFVDSDRGFFTDLSTKLTYYWQCPDSYSPCGYGLFYNWCYSQNYTISGDDMNYYHRKSIDIAVSNAISGKSLAYGRVEPFIGTTDNVNTPPPMSHVLHATYGYTVYTTDPTIIPSE